MPTFPSLQQMTVGAAILGACYTAVRHRAALTLELVVGGLLAASSLPTGIFLLGCAFDTSLISQLTHELGLYLAAAAVALLYVSLKELFK